MSDAVALPFIFLTSDWQELDFHTRGQHPNPRSMMKESLRRPQWISCSAATEDPHECMPWQAGSSGSKRGTQLWFWQQKLDLNIYFQNKFFFLPFELNQVDSLLRASGQLICEDLLQDQADLEHPQTVEWSRKKKRVSLEKNQNQHISSIQLH